jgi:hypothetical protein
MTKAFINKPLLSSYSSRSGAKGPRYFDQGFAPSVSGGMG